MFMLWAAWSVLAGIDAERGRTETRSGDNQLGFTLMLLLGPVRGASVGQTLGIAFPFSFLHLSYVHTPKSPLRYSTVTESRLL